MEKKQIRDLKRPEGVSSGFFDLFIYEAIQAMADKHSKLPADKQITDLLIKEIEDFGF